MRQRTFQRFRNLRGPTVHPRKQISSKIERHMAELLTIRQIFPASFSGGREGGGSNKEQFSEVGKPNYTKFWQDIVF